MKKFPADRILENILHRTENELGIQVAKLKSGDTLKIKIGEKHLTLKAGYPAKREFYVVADESGNFSDNSQVYILGSSLTGTGAMLRLGWIAVNYLICISHQGKEYYGYPKRIWINDRLMLPIDE